MKCPQCGSDIGDDSKFCKHCGAGITSQEIAKPPFTRTRQSPSPPVATGTIFNSRYEIQGKIGEGGMGEVYRATDKSLDRPVAIKILPEAFAKDKERLARFQREAKLLAALNHPNIAAIHGLEESEGRRFLVLELVEGESLNARLNRGPLEVEEAMDLCLQIGEGLESAHEKGIVHRDLKPGNIMVTPEGKAKILDFGLAKAFTEDSSSTGIDIEKSPTITAQMTMPGVVLGTAAYMSPEQARGRSVDKRTDIWAFGCVLYECLTGRRPFIGETVSDTIAHILKSEPDWNILPANIPVNIRTLLRRCLQKDPRSRLRDIGDARIEMDGAEYHQIEDASAARRIPWNWIIPISVVCILLGVLFGFLLKRSGTVKISPSQVISIIKTEPGYVLAPKIGDIGWPQNTAMDISKDGDFIIYCAVDNNAGRDGIPQLFMKRLREHSATAITGTEGGIAPFLSPDNRWIGFWRDRKLWKVQVGGGVSQELCDAPSTFGASWGENGQIVFAGLSTGLYSVSMNGGSSKILTEPDPEKNEFSHRLPHFLPDGKGILFTILDQAFDMDPRIALLDSQSGSWQVLLEKASDSRYVSTGHILFLRRGTLMAVPFDLDNPDNLGQPTAVIANAMHILNAGSSISHTAAGQYNLSDSGNLVYIPGGTIPNYVSSLVRVDHTGNVESLSAQTMPFFAPRFSPDGKSILYSTIGTERIIGIFDINRSIFSTQITGKGVGATGLFSPSGNEIVFSMLGSSFNRDIFIKVLNDDTKMEPLIQSPYDKDPSSFSRDGNLLAYIEAKNGDDILIYDFRDQSSTPFAATKLDESFPDFSPNGRLIAYCTDQEGSKQVYVSHVSGTGPTVRVSRDWGIAPLWSRDGKKLYYLAGFSEVWVADLLDEKIPSFGSPRLLFNEARNLFWGVPIRGYDISLDDQSFLTVKFGGRQHQPVSEMTLIQNWTEELKRLVPTGK